MEKPQIFPRAVLFDFDFTLADSSSAVFECVSHAFSELGLPPPEPGRVRRTIGLSLEAGLEYLTGKRDPDLQDRFSALFIAHADEVMVEMTELLPGIEEALDTLRRRDLLLGIVSTKYRHRIDTILERKGIRNLISTVVGREDVPAPKPDPRGLQLALESLNVGARESIYVGDHLVDAEAADGASVTFVGVLSGTTTEMAFAGYPHLAILPSAAALPSFLDGNQDLAMAKELRR